MAAAYLTAFLSPPTPYNTNLFLIVHTHVSYCFSPGGTVLLPSQASAEATACHRRSQRLKGGGVRGTNNDPEPLQAIIMIALLPTAVKRLIVE